MAHFEIPVCVLLTSEPTLCWTASSSVFSLRVHPTKITEERRYRVGEQSPDFLQTNIMIHMKNLQRGDEIERERMTKWAAPHLHPFELLRNWLPLSVHGSRRGGQQDPLLLHVSNSSTERAPLVGPIMRAGSGETRCQAHWR